MGFLHIKPISLYMRSNMNYYNFQPLFLYFPISAAHYPVKAPQSYIDKHKIKDDTRRTYAGLYKANKKTNIM